MFVKQKIIKVFITLTVVSLFFVLHSYKAFAGGYPVYDIQNTAANVQQNFLTKLFDETLKKAGSQAFQSALTTALNNIAYNAANYLASGISGQRAAFETRDFGDVLTDSLDAAAGDFLSVLGKEGFGGLNLCEPNFDIGLRIGLGLVDLSGKVKDPVCTFSEMKNNWEDAIRNPNFLNNFRDYFDPTGSDLGIALETQSKYLQYVADEANKATEGLKLTEGWLNVRNLAGDVTTPAGLQRSLIEADITAPNQNLAKFTGDAFVDSLNIFLNQLLIQLVRNLIYGGIYQGGGSGSGANIDFSFEGSGIFGGINAAKERFREIIQPRFNVRGDYNVLAELTICLDPNNAGPTNCVITEEFRQAIQERKTVGQAFRDGNLNGQGIFGFESKNIEPRYVDNNYPLRSMIILRTYRILPVSWEVAGNYINENFIQDNRNYSLADLLECYEEGNQGFNPNFPEEEVWCQGLIDPDWVLKAPLNYCAREGYGPELLSEPEIINGKYYINRNDNYCADQQSCIKENFDGSCEVYGYCTKEKPNWNFNANSCNPIYSTCQQFFAQDGSSTSYLKNTLSYCDESGVGCLEYRQNPSLSYDSDNKEFNFNWTVDDGIYFNKNVDSCEQEDEGCHEFIRSKNDEIAYLKKMPKYAKSFCYKNGNLKNNLTSEELSLCENFDNKFVRECKAEDVGCEFYTRVKDGFSITAQASEVGYCPAECNNYDMYTQQATEFESQKSPYLIPASAKKCSAQAVGCDEFTNLDEVAQGGEGREYYSQLRLCTDASEGTEPFYTWEGAEETGYQLKVFTLADKNKNKMPDIAGITNEGAEQADVCTEDIFNKKPGETGYDSYCREFYSKDGVISYRLIYNTINLSDNCHPYRRTQHNFVSDTEYSACAEDKRGKVDGGNVCCLGNGVWSSSQNSCVYMAIPQEGVMCSASETGCREIKGSVSNNIYNIFLHNFESGENPGWEDGGVSIASTGSQRGNKSLYIDNGNTQLNINGLIRGNKTYRLEFLAKGNTNMGANFISSQGNISFGSLSLDNSSWKKYTLTARVDREVDFNEDISLQLTGTDYYIDYIALYEVTDTHYLIQNSWVTPQSCDQDWNGSYSQHYMAGELGCYEYRDIDNNSSYIHTFTKMCASSAVGCEEMTDTKNSNDKGDDEQVYITYNKNKTCSSQDKGCELLGRTRIGGYDEIYLKNNPDKYEQILCNEGDVGCDVYKDGSSAEYYFKDPQNQTCEYRQDYSGSSYSWLKKKVSRCEDNNKNICLSDTDCSIISTDFTDKKCNTDNNCDTANGYSCVAGKCEKKVYNKCVLNDVDELCPIDNNDIKTVGIGGVGNKVTQPAVGWAGLCPISQSSCTEIIDPVSKIAVNLLDTSKTESQDIVIEKNTLYRGSAGLDIVGSLKEDSYYLNPADNKLTSGQPLNSNNSWFIYSNDNTSITVEGDDSTSFKKAIVNYQLTDNLDYTSCNGQVNYDEGCILFNQRSYGKSGFQSLKFNANSDTDSYNCNGNNCNANELIKVQADRVCDEWLACRSMVGTINSKGEEEKTCYDIGVCNGLDENNQCQSWVLKEKENQTVDLEKDNSLISKADMANISGYSKAGFVSEDYLPYGAMEQTGGVARVVNGNFEMPGSTQWYLIGWNTINNGARLISSQDEVDDDIKYPMEGHNFAAVGTDYSLISDDIEVAPDTDYILTTYINTKKMFSGQVRVVIAGIEESIKVDKNTQDYSHDWELKFIEFNSGKNKKINIKFYAINDASGEFYLDNINLRSALEVKDLIPSNSNDENFWMTPQSCRLYPQSDSMSCEYIDDSGASQKGWSGYCLEYDRGPVGNPEACLQWWPIDRVKSDGFEEGAGYSDRTPLYYCTESQPLIAIPEQEDKMRAVLDTGAAGCSSPSDNDSMGFIKYLRYDGEKLVKCGAGKQYGYFTDEFGDMSAVCEISRNKKPNIRGYQITYSSNDASIKLRRVAQPVIQTNGYAYYNPNDIDYVYFLETQCSRARWSGSSDKYSAYLGAYCSELVNTVAPSGVNKAHLDKVFPTSETTLSCYNPGESSSETCNYKSAVAPFGSILSPYPASTPELWDGGANIGTQPIIYVSPEYSDSDVPHFSFTYNSTELQNIFAESYGVWEWDWSKEAVGFCYDSGGSKVSPEKRCFEKASSCPSGLSCEAVTKNRHSIAVTGASGVCNDLEDGKGLPCEVNSCGNLSCLQVSDEDYWTCGGIASGDYCCPNRECIFNECTNDDTKDSSEIIACNASGEDSGCSDNETCNFENSSDIYSGSYEKISGNWYIANDEGKLPEIKDIKINDENNVVINGNGFINLIFNTDVVDAQLPLVEIFVDWGDDEVTSVSGVEMRDRPNIDNPHSLYHLYDYWDLKNKNKCSGNSCEIDIEIKIKDNWGKIGNRILSNKVKVEEK